MNSASFEQTDNKLMHEYLFLPKRKLRVKRFSFVKIFKLPKVKESSDKSIQDQKFGIVSTINDGIDMVKIFFLKKSFSF